MAKYKTLSDGEWSRMRIKNQKMGCCDCGLIHEIDFKIVAKGTRKFLYARFKRNNRATAAMRRHKKNSQNKDNGS